MKKKIFNKELHTFYFFKREYFFIALFIVLYTLSLFLQTLDRKGNLYDFLLSITEFHALFYCITPIYLITITFFFSIGSIQNYLIIRFKNKRAWYIYNVKLMIKLVTIFCIVLFTIIFVESISVLDSQNKWSKYAVNFYSFHNEFLITFSPIIIVITNFSLLWLFLFLCSLIYYLIYILTKKILLAFLFSFLLIGLNIIAKLSQLSGITDYLFYNRVDIFQYMYLNDSIQNNYPFEIFIYWILLITTTYLIGFLVINKLDITKGK